MPDGVVPAGDACLECQIVRDIQARNQIELLEHQAQPVAAQRSAGGVVEVGDLHVVEPDVAAIGGIEPCDQVQQRAFPRAGFARQRDALAGCEIEIHPAQYGDVFAG